MTAHERAVHELGGLLAAGEAVLRVLSQAEGPAREPALRERIAWLHRLAGTGVAA